MKINEIINEGYYEMPSMDRERYTDLSKEGLEGPFMTRSGKVVYYDPKEGKYYDRDSDMYLSHEEFQAYDKSRPEDDTMDIKMPKQEAASKNIADHINETVIVNEAQFYIWDVMGNTVIASAVGPDGQPAPKDQARRINIGQKVLDMSSGMPTLRDKLPPAAKDNQLTKQIVDIQGALR